MKSSVIVAAAAAGALAVAGCGSSSSAVPPPAAPPSPVSPRSAWRARSPARWPSSGRSSCTSRSSRSAKDNLANKTKISIVQGDTQLNPAQATTVTQQFTSNSKIVAVVGPAGSQEVEAVGPLMARAGMPFISGSATAAALTTGKYPTFFRTVSKDSVQGPQDAHYIINNLHPKALMIVDDQEAYSTGLVAAMMPIFQAAGIKVDHESVSQKVTDFSSLVAKITPSHDRGGAALAGGVERAAVRPQHRPGAQEGRDLRHGRPVLAGHVHHQRLVRVLVRPGHHRDSRRRGDRRGRARPSTATSARSARRCSRRST